MYRKEGRIKREKKDRKERRMGEKQRISIKMYDQDHCQDGTG